MNQTTANSSREFAIDIVRQLRSAGYIALWAGGCVRDLLMGRVAQDYDVATNATPEQVRDLLGRRRTLSVGHSFGVIIALPPDRTARQVEVATFRSEGVYLDGRRPSHVQFSTPEVDAQRRDFTINGMFYDPIEEQVLDYVGGQIDLRRKLLRAIGVPHERMIEDKLRLLRAVRFAATLEFQIEDQTQSAVSQLACELNVVSAERISQELRKILTHRTRVRGVHLLNETGLRSVIFPEVSNESDVLLEHTLGHLPESASFELSLAVILHQLPATPTEPRTASRGSVWEVARRLKLSTEEMSAIAWLISHLDQWNDAARQTEAQLKRVLAHPRSAELRQLIRAVRLAQCLPLVEIDFVDRYATDHTAFEINPPELISGRDLIERGLVPGPEFKQLLDLIRDAQLNGEVTTREAALALISTR